MLRDVGILWKNNRVWNVSKSFRMFESVLKLVESFQNVLKAQRKNKFWTVLKHCKTTRIFKTISKCFPRNLNTNATPLGLC